MVYDPKAPLQGGYPTCPGSSKVERLLGSCIASRGSLLGLEYITSIFQNKYLSNQPSCTARHRGTLQHAMAPSQTGGRHGTSSLIQAPYVPRSGAAYPQGVAKATQPLSGRHNRPTPRPPQHARRENARREHASRPEQASRPVHVRPACDGPYDHFFPDDPSEAFPFAFTHKLLSFVQKLLEQTLFYWSEAWLPGLLDLEGWETPEEGELNIWQPALRNHSAPDEAFSRSVRMNQRLLESLLHNNMRFIRHAAVHRKPTPIFTLRRMLSDAQQLTTGLREVSRGDKLKAIAKALQFGDVKEIEEIMASSDTASGDGQRRSTPKPAPVTIDLTGDEHDSGKDDGDKKVGGSDHGDVAPATTKPPERLIIDLTDDD